MEKPAKDDKRAMGKARKMSRKTAELLGSSAVLLPCHDSALAVLGGARSGLRSKWSAVCIGCDFDPLR